MVRECAVCLLLLPALLAVTSCSWILDFSDRAIPTPDAPYVQAECDYEEPNDTAATAALVARDDTGPAAICAGDVEDRDFYRFTVPAMTAKVEIRISTRYWPGGDLDLRLYDAAGTSVLARSTSFGDDELIACPNVPVTCPALAPGDYVFEVYPGVAGAVNRYTFSVAFPAM